MDLINFMNPGSRPKAPMQKAEGCGVMEPVKPGVSNWKPRYEVEQWKPELDDWIERCRMSDFFVSWKNFI